MSLVFGLLVSLAAAAVMAFAFPQYGRDLRAASRRVAAQFMPCRFPETFRITAVDERFDVTTDAFSSAVDEAVTLWENAAGRTLFSRSEPGGDAALDVSLSYDDRQAATDKLRDIGVTIDSTRAGYDRLKAQYEAAEAAYKPAKAKFDGDSVTHESRVRAYEAEVAKWNARGGAPKDAFAKLNAERAAIDAEASRLNAARESLNEQVKRINAMVTVVNRQAGQLNLAAETYNGVSTSRGAEFEQGLFTGNEAGGTIQIFEFESREKLVRVLAHEFGHALGMEHVDANGAIMSRVNSGNGIALSDADVAELRRVCGVKSDE